MVQTATLLCETGGAAFNLVFCVVDCNVFDLPSIVEVVPAAILFADPDFAVGLIFRGLAFCEGNDGGNAFAAGADGG